MKCNRETMRLYAVTDRSWVGQGTLKDQVACALRGGVTCVQLREKELDLPALLAEAQEIGALCRSYGVPFLINDSVEAALQCRADGVHVGQQDQNAREARRLLGPDRILGVSARTVEQAVEAEKTAPTIWASAPSLPPPPSKTPGRSPMRRCRPFAGRCPFRWWPLGASAGTISWPCPAAA